MLIFTLILREFVDELQVSLLQYVLEKRTEVLH